MHHLDIGWKPSDLEQREGRIIRQGNHNKKVHIFRYVTESTFDSYMWQLIENKQKFISQIMTSKAPVRSCEDVDEAALSYAEVKALATGNPAVKEKMALDVDVAKLKLLKANHMNNQYRLEDDIARNFPQQIAKLTEIIDSYKADIAHFSEYKITDPEQFSMEISGKVFTEKKEAGAALLAVCKEIKSVDAAMDIGSYQGFNMRIQFDSWSKELYDLQEDDRLFPITKYYLEHEMQRGIKESGVKRIRVHDLRHSHASMLIELGFSPLEIANRLGHEKVETTLNTYSHLYPNKRTKLAERLDREYKGDL